MKVLDAIDQLPLGLRFAMTIGMFDGVHRGHRRALATLIKAAAEHRAKSVALTFDPHPSAVLRDASPPLLCPLAERLARIGAAGVDFAVVQRFDREFADQAPEKFLERLCRGRDLAAIVMTAESAFGRDRAGMADTVRELGRKMGFAVVDVPKLRSDDTDVSSSRIRELVGQGRLAEARRLLGRDYALTGEVVRGNRRGRELGYPTANLRFDKAVALPPDGVYAVRAGWGGDDPLTPRHTADGVASLGVRPTFGGGARLFEAHLFDTDADLYGKQLRVEIVRRLRGEKKFTSAESLVRQMAADSERARSVLARRRRPTTA